jgi:hypothetical protein
MQVIMIARLHAMYQRSKIMLIFLVIIFLAVNIACGIIVAILVKDMVGGKFYLSTWRTKLMGQTLEEQILSGTFVCTYGYEGNVQLLASMIWTLNTVWEVVALCLAVWVTVKHFCDLRRLGPLTGSTIGDCFRVLIRSHAFYFARWACNVVLVIFLLKFHTCQFFWCLLPPAWSRLSRTLCAQTCRWHLLVTTADHFCRVQIWLELRYSKVLFKF